MDYNKLTPKQLEDYEDRLSELKPLLKNQSLSSSGYRFLSFFKFVEEKGLIKSEKPELDSGLEDKLVRRKMIGRLPDRNTPMGW